MADALSPTMTLRDFENGYWYLDQVKNFAERIGIPAATKLRKDELEKAIVVFLRTGHVALPTNRSLRRTGVKDVERGLALELRIENYTSNRETKSFIVDTLEGDRAWPSGSAMSADIRVRPVMDSGVNQCRTVPAR